jgi:hypothetical protein
MRRFSLVALAGAMAAGCGTGERAASPPPPRLPDAVADILAQQSRAVAASLERGDTCTARLRLRELTASAESAVVSGAVPRAFREPLLGAVADLSARMPACSRPPVPVLDEQRDEHVGKGKGKGKGRGKRKGKGKGHD